jgi:hypothetical protein
MPATQSRCYFSLKAANSREPREKGLLPIQPFTDFGILDKNRSCLQVCEFGKLWRPQWLESKRFLSPLSRLPDDINSTAQATDLTKCKGGNRNSGNVTLTCETHKRAANVAARMKTVLLVASFGPSRSNGGCSEVSRIPVLGTGEI